jgi:MFS family permease
MLVAPLLATSNQLVGLVAPRGMVTEAYAWPLTALVVGFAAGIAVCGALVQAQGWHAAVLAAALAAGIGFLCTLARRGSLDAAIGASHAEPAREEHPAPQLVGLP